MPFKSIGKHSCPSKPERPVKRVFEGIIINFDKDYREQLEDLWRDAPDVLKPADVQKLTGYSQSYVSSWLVTGKLRTVTVLGSPITAREWLIEFMSTTGRLLPIKGK